MEIKGLILALLAAFSAIVGLFGWSYKSLRARMYEMEIEVLKRPERSEIRTLMTDKLEPLQVEYRALTNRLDELKRENHKLNDKVDRLLEICTKLAHDKKN